MSRRSRPWALFFALWTPWRHWSDLLNSCSVRSCSEKVQKTSCDIAANSIFDNPFGKYGACDPFLVFQFLCFFSRAWLNPCKNRWFRMVLCFKTFFDGKCDIARNAIFDNPFGKYGRVGPEAYFRDCLFFYELCSFVVREPCLGLSGGLGEPWAPKFPDSAQPLKSLIFIKEYRSF